VGEREKVNILMVDDQPAKLLSYETILNELGENLIKANSGREALELLLKHNIAVVLMDVSMPELDGFELAEMMHEHPRFQKTAIIFISAVHMTDLDRLKGYERGAMDYISVPVIPGLLRAKVSVFAELHRKTQQLETLNDQLAAANKELEAFSYSVSHDLRAPLRQVDGFSKILLREFGPQLDSGGQHYLERIREGVQRMGRLVDDLLNLGRVGRQVVVRRPTALKATVMEALAELKPEIVDREIEWRIGDLPLVQCDPGLMKLVFANLLSNAIKFTRQQKQAVIEVGQMIVEGQPVIFVRDNGVGFNMRYAHKLFGIFQRLHRQGDFEGTGVGLANVQRIIHRHGGHVWAKAEPYKGATFFFTLPGTAVAEPESHATVRGRA
jgi:two-component system, sensor histidine kinase and response regulator